MHTIDIPKKISSMKEYCCVLSENEQNIVLFCFGDNDYSYWITENMKDDTSGFSSRGTKEELIEELKDSGFVGSSEILRNLENPKIGTRQIAKALEVLNSLMCTGDYVGAYEELSKLESRMEFLEDFYINNKNNQQIPI